MKVKYLIRLICLVLIIAFCAVWMFGGMKIGTTVFKNVDTAVRKGGDLGPKYIAAYKVGNPDDADPIDIGAATDEAAAIIRQRLDDVGYEGAIVRKLNNDHLWIELPEATSASGLEIILENRGVLEISTGSGDTKTVVFTNDDVKSAKFLGVDSTAGKCYMEIHLNKDAKSHLETLTSGGQYSMNVTMDGDAVAATYSGSEIVKNGVMRLTFASTLYEDALTLAYCVNSGAIKGKLTADTDYAVLVQGNAGNNVRTVMLLAAAAIFVIMAVYFLLAHRGLGLAAVITALAAVTALAFFVCTFTWLQTTAYALAGLGLAFVLIFLALAYTLSEISGKYASGKDVMTALDDGTVDAAKVLTELLGVAAAAGIALWICGGAVKALGIALFGGAVIAFLASRFLLKHTAKLLIGVGLDDTKALGLKRGE